ncbi:unnamed protein product, partial [Nesidiocoris tenuis]
MPESIYFMAQVFRAQLERLCGTINIRKICWVSVWLTCRRFGLVLSRSLSRTTNAGLNAQSTNNITDISNRYLGSERKSASCYRISIFEPDDFSRSYRGRLIRICGERCTANMRAKETKSASRRGLFISNLSQFRATQLREVSGSVPILDFRTITILPFRRRSGEISYPHFVKTATIPMVPYVTTLNFHDISNVHVQ